MEEDGRIIPGSETDLDEVEMWYRQNKLLNRLYSHGSRIQFPYLGLLFHREIFDTLGFYDPQIFTEDYDMMLRIASSQIKIEFLNHVVGIHRGGGRTHIYQERTANSVERAIRKNASSLFSANKMLAYLEINRGVYVYRSKWPRMIRSVLAGCLRFPSCHFLFAQTSNTRAYSQMSQKGKS